MTKEGREAKQLLKQVSGEVKQIEYKYSETGSAYNLFKIACIGENEEIISKVMADLLNPKGLHYQGSIYLDTFLKTIVWPSLKKEQVDKRFQLSKAKIKLEDITNEGRFIDITINDGKIFIPIEVKINAPEQPNQLRDYAKFSSHMNKRYGFIPVLFLTKNGRKSDKPQDNGYIPISFEKDIITWLEKCLNLEKTQKIPPVREIIKQLIRTIKSFCDQLEHEEMECAIKKLITEKRENYVLAKRIHEAYQSTGFIEKAWDIFKEGQIYKQVKQELPDAEIKEKCGGWSDSRLDIPIGNGCILGIQYDMKSIRIEKVPPKKPHLAAEITDKIREVMLQKTDVRSDGEKKPKYIWASDKIKCPDIEDTDDEDIYFYDLHQIYSTKPELIADWIVSLARELEKN